MSKKTVLVGIVAGGLFGAALNAALTEPPDNRPLLGYVKPATQVEYRDKEVKVVPESCKTLPVLVEQWSQASSKYSNALDQVGLLVKDMRVAIIAKDQRLLAEQMDKFDGFMDGIYVKPTNVTGDPVVKKMYDTNQEMHRQLARCIKDITN